MTIRRTTAACLALWAFAALAPSPASAATSTWSGASNVTWATTTNWSDGIVPGTGDTAVFGAATSNDIGISVGSGVTVKQILFSSAVTGSRSITAGTGSITLDDGGSIVYDRIATGNFNQTISRPIILSGSATFTNNNTTGNLLVLSGSISGSGPIVVSGSGSLNTNGSVQVSAANTSFTGSWDVRSGYLDASSSPSALGASTASVTLNGGILQFGVSDAHNVTVNSSNGFFRWNTNNATWSGTLTINSGVLAAFSTGGNAVTWSGAIVGDSTASFANNGSTPIVTLSGSANNTLSGTYRFNGSTGTYTLDKSNGATAVAGNLLVSPFNGGTVTVRWSQSNQIADTSVVTLSGTSPTSTGTALLQLQGKSDTIGGLVSTGSVTSIVQNQTASTTGTLTMAVASGTSYTFGGTLRDGASAGQGVLAIGIAGSGTQVLSGSNTFSGGATINGGVLRITNANALGTGTATLSAGTLDLGTLSTATNAIVLSGGTLANGTVDVSQVTANSGSISAILAGGAFVKATSGTVTLSGTNTYSGNTTISAGILSFSSTNGLRGTSGVTIAGGAGLTYTGATDLFGKNVTVTAGSGTGTITNSGGGTLTLSGRLSKDNSVLRLTGGAFNVTGLITGTTVGASDLVVAGTSSVTLSNTNTYNGPTFVIESSTLSLGINNAIPNSSVVTLGNASSAGTLQLNGYTDAIGGLAFGTGGGTLRLSATSTSAAPLTAATGTMTLTNGTLDLAGSGSTAGVYRVLAAQSVAGSFTSVTGASEAYQVVTTSTSVDYQQKAVLGSVTVTNPAVAIITGGSAAFTYTVANTNLSGGASLSYTGTGLSDVAGSSSGSAGAASTSGATAGLYFTGTTTGSNQTSTFAVDAPTAYGSTSATGTVSVNVYAHAAGSAAGATIALPDSIVGYTGSLLGLTSATISNAAGYRVDLMTTGGTVAGFVSINNVSGVGAGSAAQIYAAAGLDGTQVVGSNALGQTFNLTYADNSALSGASSSLGSQSITVTGNVLDHALPGFSAPGIVDPYTTGTLNINFGTIDQSAGVQNFTYNLLNLASQVYGTGLTAGLDFTGVSADGNGFTSGLTTFNNLVAGGTSSQFTATFTPSGQGSFNQTFTLSFYDNQSIAGASARRDLTISAHVLVVPEPGALVLAGVGLAAVGWSIARRRRRV